MAEFLGLEILTDAMLIGMWKIEVFIFMMSFNASIVYLVWFLNKLSLIGIAFYRNEVYVL